MVQDNLSRLVLAGEQSHIFDRLYDDCGEVSLRRFRDVDDDRDEVAPFLLLSFVGDGIDPVGDCGEDISSSPTDKKDSWDSEKDVSDED